MRFVVDQSVWRGVEDLADGLARHFGVEVQTATVSDSDVNRAGRSEVEIDRPSTS